MAWFGVVLGGGGAKGEFSVGVLQGLARRAHPSFRHFDFVGGVSVGALGAAAIAQSSSLSVGVRNLAGFWDDLAGHRDVYRSPVTEVGGAVSALAAPSAWARDAVYSTEPLADEIRRHVRWERLAQQDGAGGRRPAWAFRVVSLTDGRSYTVSNDDDILGLRRRDGGLELSLDPSDHGYVGRHIHDLILASASQPLLFPPVDVLGHRLCDGGIRDLTPLGVAIDAYRCHLERGNPPCPEDRLVLVTNVQLDLPRLEPGSLASGKLVMARVVDIISAEIVRNDVRATERLNRLATEHGPREDTLPLTLVHVSPEQGFGLGAMDFDDREARRRMREHGHERSQRVEVLTRASGRDREPVGAG